MNTQATVPSGHEIDLQDFRMHYLRAGAGADVVVLLHGWGQTCHEWRHIIPGLAQRYTVIAPDMRGLGDSGKPSTGYDQRTLARDISELIARLGFQRIFVVGHDFGVPVAYAFAKEYPAAVRGLVVMEFMLPGFGGELGFQVTRNTGRWHLVFHARCEIAEMLIQGKEREYLSWFYRSFAFDKEAITDQDIDEYVRCYAAPGAMGTSLEYYRALFDQEDQNRVYGKTRLAVPVLALGGESNMGDRVRQMMEKLADKVSGGSVERSGHWIPEERPDYLLRALPGFFDSCGK